MAVRNKGEGDRDWKWDSLSFTALAFGFLWLIE